MAATGDDLATAPLVTLTPEELAARLAEGNVRLIDVRTDEEVAEGVIPGAEHIPLDRFDPATLGPDDGREVVLYCRSDRRSGVAGEKLAAATGEPATHLEGGILAWEAAGLPVTKQP
jgi:rhodanese-related sulfurtransferase